MTRASRAFHHPWASPPKTPAAFQKYLDKGKLDDFLPFVVCRVADDAIVGVINLSQIQRDPAYLNAHLGYYGSREHAEQGYMSEGLALMIRFAFFTLRLHRLEANIQPGNRRSTALVKRLGFRFEGLSRRMIRAGTVWKDHERWALTADEVAAR